MIDDILHHNSAVERSEFLGRPSPEATDREAWCRPKSAHYRCSEAQGIQSFITHFHNPDHPKFFPLGGHLRHNDGDDLVDLVEPHWRDSWKLEKIPRWWGHVPFSQGKYFTFKDNQPNRCFCKLDSNPSIISSAKSVSLRKRTFCGTWSACWATLPK